LEINFNAKAQRRKDAKDFLTDFTRRSLKFPEMCFIDQRSWRFCVFALIQKFKTKTERERGFGMNKEDNCGYYVDKRNDYWLSLALRSSFQIIKITFV
jgi:hypothetical protein